MWFLIGLVPAVFAELVFAMAVGPWYFFDGLVLDPLRNGPGRVLPLKLSPELIVFVFGLVSIGAVAFLVRPTRFPSHLVWLARAIAILALGLVPFALQRADTWHLTYTGAVVAGLAVVSLGIVKADFVGRMPTLKTQAVLGLLAVVLVFGLATVTTRRSVPWTMSYVSSNGRSVPVLFFGQGSGTPRELERLLREINNRAAPGQRLFVGPRDLRFANYNDVFIYFLLPKLAPASRYFEMNPWSANRPDSGLAEELASADWLILSTRYDRWNEPNASMKPGSPVPNEIVQSRFCRYGDYGAWSLLRRCSISGF